MHEKIQNICDELNQLIEFTDQQATANNPEIVMSSNKGWHHPSITPREIVEIIENLVKKIEKANIENLDDLNVKALDQVPERINLLIKQGTIQHLFNGNAHQALPAFMTTLDWLQNLFEPRLSFEKLKNPYIPNQLKRRLNRVSNNVDSLEVDTKELNKMVSLILEAHETAENLPTDIAELNSARKAVEKALSKIEETAGNAEEKSGEIDSQLEVVKKLLADSEKAYSISITKGLASAFQDRARNLTISMWVWTIGLLATLIFALFYSGKRLETLNQMFAQENPDISLILIHLLLSLISLGAPIWFAWLSTKQIGQNFRLSEDYKFKSTVAKVYEGYRREAARIDPAMEAKLLYSALDRLDEAPLRYVDDSYHSTPWEELISSPEFRNVLDTVPEFKNRFLDILNKSVPKVLKENINPKDL